MIVQACLDETDTAQTLSKATNIRVPDFRMPFVA